MSTVKILAGVLFLCYIALKKIYSEDEDFVDDEVVSADYIYTRT